jgi:hypothetical protein
MPATLLVVAAPVVVALAWSVVRRGGVSVWIGMGTAMAILGAVALATGQVPLAARLSGWVAAAIGVAAGAALYLATAAFMATAGRWPPLARHTSALYDQRGGMPLWAALAIGVLVVAPGEEIVWRGAVQGIVGATTGPVAAAVLVWVLYVGVNAAAFSIPILLAAAVGGAAWGALALWTGGVAASIACHAVWTGLMIARPPIPRPAR